MPTHRDLLGKLLHTNEILQMDAEQFIQSAQVVIEVECDWRRHHLLIKSNVSRIRRLLSVGDSNWLDEGQLETCPQCPFDSNVARI